MNNRNFFLYIIFGILLISSVSAALNLPANIEKIREDNKVYFNDFSLKITFFIAFLAGILGILSPCILPIIPAYFSYTFKEKKNITFMTLVFALGFTSMFVVLGVIAGILGQQTLNMVQNNTLIRIASVFIFLFGLMSLFGKTLPLPRINLKTGNDVLGVFLFGTLFAISWTGCLGPILSGILGMGAILGDYVKSGMLMFFYGMGSLVPLFILSIFYDRFNLQKYLKGRSVKIRLFGKDIELNSINILSGSLLMISAVFLMIYANTKLFNNIDPLGTKMLFYDYQNQLLQAADANFLSIAVFSGFFLLVAIFLIRRYKRGMKR